MGLGWGGSGSSRVGIGWGGLAWAHIEWLGGSRGGFGIRKREGEKGGVKIQRDRGMRLPMSRQPAQCSGVLRPATRSSTSDSPAPASRSISTCGTAQEPSLRCGQPSMQRCSCSSAAAPALYVPQRSPTLAPSSRTCRGSRQVCRCQDIRAHPPGRLALLQ